MFQQMFAEMNDMLSDIAARYAGAGDSERRELMEKYRMLRRLSDEALDEWLVFAEHLSRFRQAAGVGDEDGGDPQEAPFSGPAGSAAEEAEPPELAMDQFVRGQGYYKLQMYPQCVASFLEVLDSYPDSLPARLYLAMSHLYQDERAEARTHLEHMLQHVRGRRLKAMLLNAIGCIAAGQRQFGEAEELFLLAAKHDPAMPEPARNLEVCRRGSGKLLYGSDLTLLL
ncbi:hypothetical protein F4V43_04740 [Paenibacillus spiritus]|uniref:Tetratricopeptide repeat protein n=1 Tax=Paenibacillus spiritus TaxID=2496557 RepID=A0A5J5GER1_9BACL|nr:tetratricopeptide repeat protein [Paenibacillus spiritus]KAA9006272.1 hypothetical protein F4V43_04740 [Paenibacillus spiritus]